MHFAIVTPVAKHNLVLSYFQISHVWYAGQGDRRYITESGSTWLHNFLKYACMNKLWWEVMSFTSSD